MSFKNPPGVSGLFRPAVSRRRDHCASGRSSRQVASHTERTPTVGGPRQCGVAVAITRPYQIW